jgi:hypothetical protein
MSVRELSSYIFTGKYANDIRALRRRETRDEARRRMFDMHRDYYLTGDVPEGCVSAAVPANRAEALDELINEAESAFADGLALGSQRVLQYAGAPVLSKHARAYNCCFSFADRPRFFQEAFHLLLCGSGTGFSVQWHHVARLPTIKRPAADSESKTFLIPDTIEGWADALGVLMSSYFDSDDTPFPGYRGKIVEFSYILIRAEGSPLSTNTGKAPGPEPLRASLEKVRDLLDRCCVTSKYGKLEPIDVYDVVMHASDAVLAGGVRRSASICLFSVDDMDMARAKTGNWFSENPQRGRSNNSALLLRGSTSYEQYKQLVDWSREWGEPGVVWSDSTEMGVNPCQPAWAPILTRHGLRTMADVDVGDDIWSESGWTKIVKKWSTGVKPVMRYRTTAGSFIGTANHRVVSGGVKVEAGDAESVDRLAGAVASWTRVSASDVVDGLLIGDGTVHRAGGGVFLIVGDDDSDYFSDHDVAPLMAQRGYGGNEKLTRVNGASVTADELPMTYERRIPERFINGTTEKARGFLRGLYSANGSIVRGRVTLKTSSTEVRDGVQLMLSAIGIKSYYTTNRAHDVEFDNGAYKCRESYDVNISDDVGIFSRLIGFIQSHKTDRLMKITDKVRGTAKKTFDIIDIESLGKEEVFDITVDNDSHTYWTGGLNVSNCVEASFWPVDSETGESGWQFCNLSLGNMSAVKSMDDARRAIRAATIMGTLQAGYTSFPYLGPVSERITRREALLGVSMTGMAERPDIAFDAECLRELAQVVRDTNAEVSALLDINVAARSTCIKPEGTSTGMLGALGSGVHDVHAPRTIRHVQANRNEVQAQYFAIHNPHAVEASVWKDRDVILSFALEAPAHAAFKAQTSALDMLRRVKLVKENWVDAGRRVELCTQPWISHNVSNTVVVRGSEWDGVTNFIYENRDVFAGVSLLADGGDLDYPQAPFVEVLDPVEILSAFGRWEESDYELVDDSRNGFRDLWDAVDPVTAPAGELQESVRATWTSRFSALVNGDFGGDKRRAGHYLKSLHYWRRWQDLTSKTVAVDYERMVEDESGVDFGQIVACAGGACQVL